MSLQQHVAELGEGNTLTVPVQTRLNGIPVNHGVYREMLTDVSQEIQHRDVRCPVQIVYDPGTLMNNSFQRKVAGQRTFLLRDFQSLTKTGSAIHHVRKLGLDGLGANRHFIRGLEQTFGPFAAGVSNKTSRPTNKGDPAVAGSLKPGQRNQGNQVAHVQTGGRRVETRIDRDRTRLKPGGQPRLIGALGYQAAPAQVFQKSI